MASYSSAQQELAEIKRRSGSAGSGMGMCESPTSVNGGDMDGRKERCERGVSQCKFSLSLPCESWV